MKAALFSFLFIELLAVTYLDLKYKKISNYWIILNLLIALLFYIFLRSSYPFEVNVLIYPVSILVVGFFLFAINLMGAGDAKYLFSFYLMLPAWAHYHFFTSLLITTIFVSLLNLSIRTYKNHAIIYNAILIRDFKCIGKTLLGTKMPYAPVILVAWLFYVVDHIYEVF